MDVSWALKPVNFAPSECHAGPRLMSRASGCYTPSSGPPTRIPSIPNYSRGSNRCRGGLGELPRESRVLIAGPVLLPQCGRDSRDLCALWLDRRRSGHLGTTLQRTDPLRRPHLRDCSGQLEWFIPWRRADHCPPIEASSYQYQYQYRYQFPPATATASPLQVRPIPRRPELSTATIKLHHKSAISTQCQLEAIHPAYSSARYLK